MVTHASPETRAGLAASTSEIHPLLREVTA